MKKIGYVIPCFPTLSETFVGVDMRAMQTIGHEVVPYAFEAKTSFQPIDRSLASRCRYLSSAPAYLLPHLRWAKRSHGFIQQQSGFSYRSLLRQGAQLAYLAAQDKCQHLHAHFAWHSAATAIVAARLLNISVSFVGHGADIYAGAQDLNAKLDASDFVIAVTQEMQQQLQRQTTTPIHHIACGIEPSQYPTRVSTWAPDKGFLFIGRLVPKKGLFTLLNAMQQLSDSKVRFDIVGDGPLLGELQAYVRKHQLDERVRFLGSKPGEWYRSNAKHYQALVAPFTIAPDGDKDTGPLVLKEAMALGLPIITSTLESCHEIIDANTGILVERDNANALAVAMSQHLSRDNNDIETQRQHAFEQVMTHFNAIHQAKRFSQYIEAI